jgi:hypothetical protein
LLPPSGAWAASACSSTAATFTDVPSFEEAASTGVPTAMAGSGRTFITETITDGARVGRRSMRLPTRLPPITSFVTATTEPATGE